MDVMDVTEVSQAVFNLILLAATLPELRYWQREIGAVKCSHFPQESIHFDTHFQRVIEKHGVVAHAHLTPNNRQFPIDTMLTEFTLANFKSYKTSRLPLGAL